MIRSVDEPVEPDCPSPPGLAATGGREAASVDAPPDLLIEEDADDLLEVLTAEGIPCIAFLNASISEGLCIKTENPCFCKKKVVFGISALNPTARSHWPLFSINSRLPSSVCALSPEKMVRKAKNKNSFFFNIWYLCTSLRNPAPGCFTFFLH